MGFFPNIFKIPHGDLIPNIVTLGGYGIAKGSIKEGFKAAVPAIGGLVQTVLPAHQQSPGVSQIHVPPALPSYPNLSPGYGQGAPIVSPSYGAPLDFAPASQAFSPYEFGGTASWDYSTPSTVYSPPQWGTFSAPGPAHSQVAAPDRTWEDIVGLSSLFL